MTTPAEASPLRWGILGCGKIARTIAAAISAVPGCELRAVASRDSDKAAAFAQESGARLHFGNYAALAACAEVDVVYIATPPSRHLADCLLCLDAGKHVLCEKPFALDAPESRCMVERARERGLFLMEAMWTCFLPAIGELERLLHEGRIGTPQLLLAGGAFQPQRDPDYYLFRPELGGGVMRDAGVYLLHLAHRLLGVPKSVQSLCRRGESGVDEQDGVLLGFDSGAIGLLHVSMRARQAPFLELLGSTGRLRLQPPLFNPSGIELVPHDDPAESWSFSSDATGYRHQIAEVRDCIRDGRNESARMPLDASIAVMQTLEQIVPRHPARA